MMDQLALIIVYRYLSYFLKNKLSVVFMVYRLKK